MKVLRRSPENDARSLQVSVIYYENFVVVFMFLVTVDCMLAHVAILHTTCPVRSYMRTLGSFDLQLTFKDGL